MKDGIGQTLHEGNLVQVMIGQQPIRGFITKLKEGGMIVTTGKAQGPQAQTPDTMFLQVEVPLMDTVPGQIHPAVVRLPVPEKEIIVPVSTKEVA